jgi:hypothetical protein
MEREVSRGEMIMSNWTRRGAIGGMAAAMVPLRASAHSDFAIDWQGGEQTPEVAASLAAQIALVVGLEGHVSGEVMAYFQAQKIIVDREIGTATRAGPRGIFFERRAVPVNNPVLLHELIHRWQFERMAGGRANQDVVRLYMAVKASGAFPAQAYMLKDPVEFFAMMATVVLHGRAARPPFLRENVRLKSPEVYAFVVQEFGFDE